jgi:hypothetical protein
MAASILTLFCSNPVQAGSNAGLLTLTQPGASTSTTGWTCGKVAPTVYSRMTYNAEKASTSFGATAQPSGAPEGSAQDCWRVSDATTGNFSAGTWYSSLSCIAVTNGGAMDGRARFRLWRSANADGTAATEIAAGTMRGTQITNLGATVAQSSSASTQVAAFSLSNEYLFMQCAWEITGAGGATGADCLIRLGSLAQTTGSGLITSAFSATGGAPAAARVGGYLNRYYYGELVEGNL